jgi:putative ABC transport system permease protein
VFQFRPHAKIVEGRAGKPGTDEVVIGRRIQGRFKGLEIGQSFELKKNRPVTVVGIMEAEGASFESEVWADIDTIRSAFGREAMASSVTVALESASAFDPFRAAVENDKQLGLDAERETVFYEKQSEATAQFISVVGYIISFFFIGAAMIGAFITMNTAVANRRREIGTLRAIGFKGTSVLFAFTFEAVCLAVIGALVGLVGAFFLSFMSFSMMNFATWSEIVFKFDLTPAIMLRAVVVGAFMGLLGGFIPAWRAHNVKPADAMRG